MSPASALTPSNSKAIGLVGLNHLVRAGHYEAEQHMRQQPQLTQLGLCGPLGHSQQEWIRGAEKENLLEDLAPRMWP